MFRLRFIGSTCLSFFSQRNTNVTRLASTSIGGVMSTNQKVIKTEENNSYAADRSNQMDLLYGEERSKLVYQRLQYLDPNLNEEIHE